MSIFDIWVGAEMGDRKYYFYDSKPEYPNYIQKSPIGDGLAATIRFSVELGIYL